MAEMATQAVTRKKHGRTPAKIPATISWAKQPTIVKRVSEVQQRWAKGQRLITIAAEMGISYNQASIDLMRAQAFAQQELKLGIEDIRNSLTAAHHDDMQRIRDHISALPQDQVALRAQLEELLRSHEQDIADLYGLLARETDKPAITQVLVQVGNATPTPVQMLSDAELEQAALEAGVTEGEFEEVES